MTGQLLYYRSKLDDNLQPLPVCATDDSLAEKALLLDLSPGAIADLGQSARRCEQLSAWAREEGVECVIAKPCGRGPGTVYQGPAEVDVFEAIDFLCDTLSLDRDRVSLLGGSMGGAATWYLASHYPDRFAAAAPFCGYCDYRLWTKPGGHIVRMFPWEEASWRSREAAFRVENLGNMGLWITHGEWDIGIGGGVPVEHSRRMSRALDGLGIAHKYVEAPKCGHGCMTEANVHPVLRWIGEQRRTTNPRRVRLVAHGLRHNRSHWVTVEQMQRPGAACRVDARFTGKDRLVVETENVRRLALGPIAGVSGMSAVLDGKPFTRVGLSPRPAVFERAGGDWSRSGALAPAGEKRHGCAGPAGDLFFEPLRLVYGTRGSDHENSLLEQMARTMPEHFKQRNGGVHRGIFEGESWFDIPVVADRDLAEDEFDTCNLILLGTPRSNCVLARHGDDLDLEFRRGRAVVAGQAFDGEHVGVAVCRPSPVNPERLWLVIGGTTPQAVTGATHLNLQLLPDYLVWDWDEVLGYGFFGNDWAVH